MSALDRVRGRDKEGGTEDCGREEGGKKGERLCRGKDGRKDKGKYKERRRNSIDL